jgi:hypothetical protein
VKEVGGEVDEDVSSGPRESSISEMPNHIQNHEVFYIYTAFVNLFYDSYHLSKLKFIYLQANVHH